MAAANDPRRWNYSNPPIQNNGTNVDARLSTITTDNPTGYKKLSTTSTDPIVSQLYYAIDNNGNVTYANLVFDATNPNAPGIVRRQYNNIQEIADSGQIGYTPETTKQIKDSIATNLKQETENKILNTPQSPASTTDPNAQNPTPASGTDPESTAQTSTQPEPDATPAPDATIASLPATSGNNSPVKSGNPAYYPLDIKNNKNQDRIKFTAVEIQDKGGIGGELKYKPVTNSGPVYLSIQSPISDQNSVDWGPGTMGPIEKAMFNEAYKALSNNGGAFKAATDALGGLIDQAYKELKEVGAVGTAAMAAMAAGNINLFTRATSLALNPNLELLFNAPQLRPFAFSFLLTARSKGEVEMIKKIIKYFKYHMAVRNVESKLFLKTPHVFFIDYQYGTDETHKSINLIAPEKLATKACALMNFSVDYTPLGTYMTYTDSDKTMVAYRLNMQFMEITPVYQGDYDEGIGLDHPIGY